MAQLTPVKNYEIKNGIMVASRDIKAGDPIFIEKPLCMAPGRQSYPLCVGEGCVNYVDGDVFCEGCEWQLCSDQCKHNEKECQLLSSHGIVCDIYDFSDVSLSCDFLGGLRTLLAMECNPDYRQNLLQICTHNCERTKRNDLRYHIGCEEKIATQLETGCAMAEKGFSRDDAVGLADMYAIPVANGARALYYGPCFMASSCSPNSYSMLLSDYSILYKASVDIARGEKIYREFGNLMRSTLNRRKEIYDNYLFDCDCQRCSDPSEFGTKFGGLFCPKCPEPRTGILLPEDPLSPSGVEWKCDSCGGALSGSEAVKQLDFLRTNIDDALASSRGSIKVLELILHTPGEWDRAPPCSQHMFDVKQQYIANVGNVPGFHYSVLESGQIREKLELCREHLQALDKFHPGWNYKRAGLLYEAVTAAEALIREMSSSGQDEGVDTLNKDIQVWLKEILEIARVEEEGSIYYALREAMKAKVSS